ncbi:MAG: ABC transporter permease, partial [Bryobacteraceae bacterium]
MSRLGEAFRRLRFWRHARFDEDLAEEMRLHLDLRTAGRQAGGMNAEEARAAASRQFGNAALLRETSREAWGWIFLDRLRQDIRYGLRTLRANPGFTAAAVLSLVLGIGANTAIFGIVHAVMLRSLPVEDPNRLVQIRIGAGVDEITNPIWEQIRDHQQAFSGALAYSPDRFDLAGGGESHFANGIWVSGGFFQTLGVPALRGRTIDAADDRHGGGSSGPVAVIGYAFWMRNFGGAEDIIGKIVRLNRHPFEIVGVTPLWFTGLNTDQSYDVAIPIGDAPLLRPEGDELNGRSTWWLYLLGRVPRGETVKRAEDRLRSIAPEIFRATLPKEFDRDGQQDYLKSTFSLRPAATGFSGTGDRYRTALLMLMVTVGLVLLIGCANLANLLLARTAARQRELSIRMAMGASRGRLVRQLMTESLLLSFAGAVGGLLLAAWCGPLLVRLFSTAGRPIQIDLVPDATVLAFTLGAGILTALLFGLAPALSAIRNGPSQALKENSRGALSRSGRFGLRAALVAGQIGLSLVLLIAASLFLGTLRNLLAIDPGFSKK